MSQQLAEQKIGRLEKLRERLEERELDGLIISSPANLNYLLGTGLDFNAVGLVTGQEAILATDFRFQEATRELPPGWSRQIISQNLFSDFIAIIQRQPVSRLGFEGLHLKASDWIALSQGLTHLELKETQRLIEEIRAVKSEQEIEIIRRSANAVNEVYEWLYHSVDFQAESEAGIAWLIEERLRLHHQASGMAFDSIIAAGANGAKPHASPSQQPVATDTLVTMDFGARIGGYCSDCTRTWAIGKPSPKLIGIHKVVEEAQQAALSMLEPGRACIEVHQKARQVITEAGYGEFFNHGTGHGVGIEIHEEPRFRDGFAGQLEPGNVVTVEPGIYLPGEGGCRIEDLVLITPSGHERLTSFPKDLKRK